MNANRPETPLAVLLRILDQAFDTKAWHGTTLRGSLRGLTAEQACWRPQPGRNCIWDLILHTAYWKHVVVRRITGAKRGAFPRKPSNFPRLPEPGTQAQLDADVALLEERHRALREVIAKLRPQDLAKRSPSGKWRLAEEISGVAAHDLYHAGQIQLLKRLQNGQREVPCRTIKRSSRHTF